MGLWLPIFTFNEFFIIFYKKVLDLRHIDDNPEAPDGIECLDLIPNEDNDESVLHSVYPDKEDEENNENNKSNDDKKSDDLDNKEDEDESDEEEEEE